MRDKSKTGKRLGCKDEGKERRKRSEREKWGMAREPDDNRWQAGSCRAENDASFSRCSPIHMVIAPRYSAFIKCTASDPFRLSARLQEFLSHPSHQPTNNSKPLTPTFFFRPISHTVHTRIEKTRRHSRFAGEPRLTLTFAQFLSYVSCIFIIYRVKKENLCDISITHRLSYPYSLSSISQRIEIISIKVKISSSIAV